MLIEKVKHIITIHMMRVCQLMRRNTQRSYIPNLLPKPRVTETVYQSTIED